MTTLLYEDLVKEGEQETARLVEVDHRGDRAVVTLRDPGKLNVLSAGLVVQLRRGLDELAADDAVRSIVLTGADPGFSTGGDLRMMQAAVEHLDDPDDEDGATGPWRWIRYQFGGLVRLIARTDKAFIAAINGPAAGVGLALALTCDLAVASERAVLVPAFGKLGLIPEVGTSWRLTRTLGYHRAFEFYVGGRHVPAAEALELGLVNEVVSHEQLMDAALAWCDRVSALPRHALALAKPLLRTTADLPWEQALTTEEFAEPMCFTTAAFGRSVEGMLAKRS
jgi:2-(1,2-epoxy-1,2-dihydrophenyl)acetyl-CoA isomerase